MKKLKIILFCLLFFSISKSELRVFGQASAWSIKMGTAESSYENTPVDSIDWDACTDWMIFNTTVNENGTMVLRTSWVTKTYTSWGNNALFIEKRRGLNDRIHAHGKPVYLIIYISPGSTALTTYKDAMIRTIIDSICGETYQYDGWVFDPEPWNNADTTNMRAFLTECYDSLQNHHAWYDQTKKPIQAVHIYGATTGGFWGRCQDYVDFYFNMSWGDHGAWNSCSWFFAPMYITDYESMNVNGLVQYAGIYIAAGIPKDKYVMPVPLGFGAWAGGLTMGNEGCYSPMLTYTTKNHTTGTLTRTLSFINGSGTMPDKIYRSSGSFITNGFQASDTIVVYSNKNLICPTGTILNIASVQIDTLTLTSIGSLSGILTAFDTSQYVRTVRFPTWLNAARYPSDAPYKAGTYVFESNNEMFCKLWKKYLDTATVTVHRDETRMAAWFGVNGNGIYADTMASWCDTVCLQAIMDYANTEGYVGVFGWDATGCFINGINRTRHPDLDNDFMLQSIKNKRLSLLVPPISTLTSTETSMAFGAIEVGASSNYDTFILAGTTLSPAAGNVIVTASTGFTVSVTSGSGYASSIEIAYTSATLSNTTIYVKFSPETTIAYSGNVTCAGGTAEVVAVAVTGTGTDYEFIYTGIKQGE